MKTTKGIIGLEFPEFINYINWSQLKDQKKTLFDLLNKLENSNSTDVDNDIDNLNGLISLVDSIQDYAVNELEYDEDEIFDFNED